MAAATAVGDGDGPKGGGPRTPSPFPSDSDIGGGTLSPPPSVAAAAVGLITRGITAGSVTLAALAAALPTGDATHGRARLWGGVTAVVAAARVGGSGGGDGGGVDDAAGPPLGEMLAGCLGGAAVVGALAAAATDADEAGRWARDTEVAGAPGWGWGGGAEVADAAARADQAATDWRRGGAAGVLCGDGRGTSARRWRLRAAGRGWPCVVARRRT